MLLQSNRIAGIEIETRRVNEHAPETDEVRRHLGAELDAIHRRAFPRLSSAERKIYVGDYFYPPAPQTKRETVFFRDASRQLIASAVFDRTTVQYAGGSAIDSLYLISNTVSEAYQGRGLCKAQARHVLTVHEPDLLLVTCAQSAALHSWLGLSKSHLSATYSIYPTITGPENGRRLNLPSDQETTTIRHIFQQMYLVLVEGDRAKTQAAVNQLTPEMVRRNVYRNMFDFDPWSRDQREDHLAAALGVSPKDGVLVAFLKKRV